MGFLRDLQRASYLVSRTAGDASAVKRGTFAKRIVRRSVTRNLGRSYNRLWR